MATKKRSLDIFTVLSQVSNKNGGYYSALPEGEQKELQPFVVMRWLTGTNDARQIYFINEIVNRFVFDLGSHKELMYKLMCVASSGQGKRYQWKKAASQKTAGSKEALRAIKQYYNYSTQQAMDVIGLLSDDDILNYAEEIGWQKEEITKLKRELKKRTNG